MEYKRPKVFKTIFGWTWNAVLAGYPRYGSYYRNQVDAFIEADQWARRK